jgi:hypothetical protein
MVFVIDHIGKNKSTRETLPTLMKLDSTCEVHNMDEIPNK